MMAEVCQFQTFWKATSLSLHLSQHQPKQNTHTHLPFNQNGGKTQVTIPWELWRGGLRCLQTGSVVTLHHYLAAFSKNQNQTEDIFDTNTLWWCIFSVYRHTPPSLHLIYNRRVCNEDPPPRSHCSPEHDEPLHLDLSNTLMFRADVWLLLV